MSQGAFMSAATAHDANPYLAGAAAASLLTDLRKATDGRTGDRLSAAIRAVTKAGSTLPTAEVETAIAAIALLLAEYQPGLLAELSTSRACAIGWPMWTPSSPPVANWPRRPRSAESHSV